LSSRSVQSRAALRVRQSRAGGSDRLVDEPQFLNGKRRQDERIGIGESQATIEVIEDARQRKPAVDEPIERGRWRTDPPWDLPEQPFGGPARSNRHPTRRCRLERVGHMKIVCPRFRPVFPRMRARVGADESRERAGRNV
jgi:hypothetical protein